MFSSRELYNYLEIPFIFILFCMNSSMTYFFVVVIFILLFDFRKRKGEIRENEK